MSSVRAHPADRTHSSCNIYRSAPLTNKMMIQIMTHGVLHVAYASAAAAVVVVVVVVVVVAVVVVVVDLVPRT